MKELVGQAYAKVKHSFLINFPAFFGELIGNPKKMPTIPSAQGGQKRALEPLELELEIMNLVMLEMKFMSFPRASSALDQRPLSSTLPSFGGVGQVSLRSTGWAKTQTHDLLLLHKCWDYRSVPTRLAVFSFFWYVCVTACVSCVMHTCRRLEDKLWCQPLLFYLI